MAWNTLRPGRRAAARSFLEHPAELARQVHVGPDLGHVLAGQDPVEPDGLGVALRLVLEDPLAAVGAEPADLAAPLGTADGGALRDGEHAGELADLAHH